MRNSGRKPWYKKWWGIILAVLLWPYFLIWFIWAKSKLGSGAKVGLTAICAVFILISFAIFASTAPKTKTVNVASTALATKQVAAPTTKKTTTTTPAVATTTTPAAAAATTTTTPKKSTASTTPAPTPTPAAPAVLLDQSGSGQASTASFTTGSNWTVTYTFDCTSFGSQGNFQIYINNTDGSENDDTGANDLATSGGNTDYYYDAGQHFLQVNSECDWHVTVKG